MTSQESDIAIGRNVSASAPIPESLIVAIPLYRSPQLVADLFEALAGIGDEIAALGGTILLINDSPDDDGLNAALAAHLPALQRSAPTERLDNARNLGFVATANIALATALRRGVDVVLLNSDALPTPGALTELAAVAHSDPLIGFVSPRSNNATICNSPSPARFRGLARDEALAAHRAIQDFLPRVTYAPTAVGFCLYVKVAIVEEFGLLDPVYGRGYNEENDLVMRANLRGYRAVLANHAFVHHIGTVSFGQSSASAAALENINRRILLERYPHYEIAVRRYLEGRDYRAEHLLAGLIPDANGRLRLVFDGRGLTAGFNGTTELARALIGAFAARFSDVFEMHVVCNRHVAAVHGLDRIQGLEVLSPETLGDDPFAVAIKLAQPFDLTELPGLGALAPVTGYLFLDTIALDCQQLDIDDYRTIWDWMVGTSAFLGFISQFSADQFERRFAHDRQAVRFVARCSTDVRDYAPAAPPIGDDHILLIGNHFPHKHVTDTVAAIRRLTDRPLAVLGSGLAETQPGVVEYAAGELSQHVVNGLYDRASVVVFPSHYEGFGLPVMHALARGKPVIARDLAPLREIAARCPEAVNLHLFATTAALATAAVAPRIDWRPADPGRRTQTWFDAAKDLGDGIRRALDQFSYGDLYIRLLKMEACRRPGAVRAADDGRSLKAHDTIARASDVAAWMLAAEFEAGGIAPTPYVVDDPALTDEAILAALFAALERIAPSERLRFQAPKAFGDVRARRLLLALGTTPAPMPSAPDIIDYLVRPFAHWKTIEDEECDDTQFVHGLYRSILGRVGDAGGVATYVGELGRGRSRRYLVELFVSSSERLNLVSSLHNLPSEN